MTTFFLEDRLIDLGVIRTTLETLERLEFDESIRGEMSEILSDSRSNLHLRLYDLLTDLKTNSPSFCRDIDRFKLNAILIMTQGYPSVNLNAMFKLKLFNERTERYLYQISTPENLETVRQMPPLKVMKLLVEDLMESTRNRTNFTDKTVFEENVFQKYVAFMFICYSCDDPLFYGSE